MSINKIAATAFLSAFLFMMVGCVSVVKDRQSLQMPVKQYDLVLVHGLSNMYCWSDDFLMQFLKIWGTGNVYAVYTNESRRVWEKEIDGEKIICCGEDNYAAGDDYIEIQSEYLQDAVEKLQESYGLGDKFCIIAHSMGGIVSRHYVGQHPERVAGLVTLATPHHGSPLADSFGWVGFFMGAGDAIDNLSPDYLEQFNRQFPVPDSSNDDNCKIYTISGDSDGYDSFGWGGELFFGWPMLRLFYWTDNDGIVPAPSTFIDGAVHIGHFPDLDHYDLVREPDVAVRAAKYLP
jgi:triacylglycerol lipase